MDGRGDFCSKEHMQAIPPRVGQWCWAIEAPGSLLPAGLADRTPVRILRPAGAGCLETHRVEDEARRPWRLPRVNTDAGYCLWIAGRRVYEGAEEFGDHLFRIIDEARSAVANSPEDDAARARLIDHWRWLLERNGWNPDGPLPAPAEAEKPRRGSPRPAWMLRVLGLRTDRVA